VTYDYRGARDRIFGIVREGDKVKAIIETTATITERTLLLALVEFAPNIEPSLSTLAKMLGTDPRCIRRLLRSCETKKLLRVTPRSEAGVHVSNHYELLCEPGLTVPTDSKPVGVQSPNPAGAESGGVRVQGPTKQTKKADKKADKVARSASHTQEPLKLVPDEPEETSDHVKIRSLYFQRFESVRGAKPPFDSRDGKAIKELLAKCSVDQAVQAIEGAFRCFRADTVTIRVIANDPAQFIGAKAAKGHHEPKQPNGGTWQPIVENR
jgi:hypothetical protein